MGSSQSTDSGETKKSLYMAWQEKKRGKGPSDEDIKKYTGMTRDELNTWAETQPGVGKNQLAGKISVGPASGFGGVAAAGGYGGWGPSAEPNDGNRGMKFPPRPPQQQPKKEVLDDDSE
ncbi:hypothetical protein PT974_02238 [Cladobotryum mycophilum]|uniref:Uncharacterized protein n=1 Tax=Cladobotryum mycophilum TaxID=491253 RepID=A0ABR0SYV2_9HYPO